MWYILVKLKMVISQLGGEEKERWVRTTIQLIYMSLCNKLQSSLITVVSGVCLRRIVWMEWKCVDGV